MELGEVNQEVDFWPWWFLSPSLHLEPFEQQALTMRFPESMHISKDSWEHLASNVLPEIVFKFSLPCASVS